MKTLLVSLVPADNYDLTASLRMQHGWEKHAAYMDELAESGFIILGGPVGNGWTRTLVLNAQSEAEVHSRFSIDPWVVDKMLSIAKIEEWDIWLQGKSPIKLDRSADKAHFSIRRKFGPKWNYDIGIREQEGWKEHAKFMDMAAKEGLIIFGGPISSGPDVQLAGYATSMEYLLRRLSEDPWTHMGLLEVVSTEKWDILLGRP